MLDALRASPAGHAGTLAAELGISRDVALSLLERFVGRTLGEIGNLPAQALRDAERA